MRAELQQHPSTPVKASVNPIAGREHQEGVEYIEEPWVLTRFAVAILSLGLVVLALACVDKREAADEHFDLAIDLQEAGRTNEAIDEYTQAISQYPEL